MLFQLRTPGASQYLALEAAPDGTWREPTSSGETSVGSGWYALPGLADAHSHLASDVLDLRPGNPEQIRQRAFACIERGTFLVIDKGWSDDSVVATLTGLPPAERPDFEAAGRMIAVDGGYYPGFATETDADGLSEVVAGAAQAGRGWVKLVGDWPRKGRGALPNFAPEALATAVEVARRGGARVAIHTMAPEVASWAVEAGVDSIEHGLFLTCDDMQQLGARNGVWVPTVVRMEATREMLGAYSSGGRLISEGLDNVADLLARAPRSLTVLAGTDLAAGPGEVADEAAGLIRLGLDPQRAVDAASRAAYSYLGRSERFEAGAPADAVFFAADPYADPATLGRPVAVVRGGKRLR